ncbi:MAG TPA: OmpA family protein [Saprospiraceae bacterium]|nr:OmpA family protein [Saprospiraceae bacterium]
MKYKLSIWAILAIWLCSFTAEAQKLKAVQQIEGIPPHIEYRAITHDPAGNIYVATSADVFMIPANSNRAQPMKAGDQIMDIDWSTEYGLIMLTRQGEIRFVSSGKVIPVDAGTGATCMDMTKNVIWVGTDNGVFTVSIPQEKIMKQYTTEDGVLVNNQITFIHTDPSGVRWVGTKAGVARINGKKWKLYEKDHAVTAITSTSEGAWMAADNMMWLVDRYNRWFPIDAWKNLTDGNVKALAADAKGIIYIASNMLVKYDPYQEKVLTMNENSISEQMIVLDQGPGKNVWMAGHNGMSRIMEDTTAIVLPEVKGNDIAAAMEVKSKPVCEGMTTGHLQLVVEGGNPPYTYKWNYDQHNSDEATRLSPGLYQVTITDQTGKSTVASGIIPSSPPMSVTLKMDAKASDKLAEDGKATAVVKGGAEPYQYLWNNGESTAQAVKLNEGQHSLRVIDDNGCIAGGEVTMEGEKVLKSLDISTLTLGQTIRVEKLYFDADSSTIQSASFGVLEEIYDFLSKNKSVIIEIGGHTNGLPEDDYCDRLSTARAKNIAEYLYNRGIPEAQISYKGYGKRQPIATNATVEGRRRNQRVEIKITSM